MQHIDTTYEIIVVDNNSDTPLPEAVTQHARVIQNKSNTGVAHARNQGLRAAQGAYCMLLDDDTFIQEGSIAHTCKYIQDNPKIGIIGPRILFPTGTLQESARPFPSLLGYIYRPKLLPLAQPTQVDWVIGACQIFSKKLLTEIGYLDEQFFYGYEDIDWCKRAHKHGLATYYYPTYTVVHDYARSSRRKPISKLALEHGKSILRYFKKHYSK